MLKAAFSLALSLCVSAIAGTVVQTEQTLYFVVVSEGEPITDIQFTNVVFKSVNTDVKKAVVTVFGDYPNRNRNLFLSGYKVDRNEKGQFGHTLEVEIKNEGFTLPVLSTEVFAPPQEVHLIVSVSQSTLKEISLKPEQEERAFLLGNSKGKAGTRVLTEIETKEEPLPQIDGVPEPQRELGAPPPLPTGATMAELKKEEYAYHARVSSLLMTDPVSASPMLGFSISSFLDKRWRGELRLSAAAGASVTGNTAIVVEPGALVQYLANLRWGFATGFLFQHWFGGERESFFVPTIEVLYTFEKKFFWKLRQVSLAYNRVLGADLHANQARISLIFTL